MKKLESNLYKELYNNLPEETIGNRIRKMRLLKGLTQEMLAAAIGVKSGTMDTYEFDEAYPSPKMILKLAEYFYVPVEYFYDDYYRFVFSDFPLKLKSWRFENNLTQRQAAKMLNVNDKTYWSWENGQYMDRISFSKICTFHILK